MNNQNTHDQELTQLQNHIHNSRDGKKSPLTINEILELVKEFLKNIHEENPTAIVGYVAGSITSDGPLRVEENIEKLAKYAIALRKIYSPHIFSSKEIFAKEEQDDITALGEDAQIGMRTFWRNILKSGYITDLFMIPGWERSKGANDEHDAAKEYGVKINYVKEDVLLS